MSVLENVEYGLRVRRVAQARAPPARRRRRWRWCACRGLGERKPVQLSGGQRQRVALARAIVNEPEVLLLDEPLGALDLKLRQEMQLELKRIQREVGITFIFVTHDQEEALTMSDRLVVLNQGRIEQLGTPGRGLRASRQRVRGRLHRRLQPARARRPPLHDPPREDPPARPRRRRAARQPRRGRAHRRGRSTSASVTRYVVELRRRRHAHGGPPEPRDRRRRGARGDAGASVTRRLARRPDATKSIAAGGESTEARPLRRPRRIHESTRTKGTGERMKPGEVACRRPVGAAARRCWSWR